MKKKQVLKQEGEETREQKERGLEDKMCLFWLYLAAAPVYMVLEVILWNQKQENQAQFFPLLDWTYLKVWDSEMLLLLLESRETK
jgi:3'-phosphoadenosine 5'-phosphosulfate sulfotransferase (PAPS reductase)/FAD synthetase